MDFNPNLKKYSKTYSAERLSSFSYSDQDTVSDITENYSNNIRISQAIYPELCTLEIILRNAIDSALRKNISETWIEDEVRKETLLYDCEYENLIKAYNDAKRDCQNDKSKVFTMGKVIANLNFGFWTNLCAKKYKPKIWHKTKCFQDVFVNCPGKQSINYIAKKLCAIRKFRNRVFHYEKIFKYPEKTLEMYNNIIEILFYLPSDKLNILEQTTTFLDTYKSLTSKVKGK